MRRVACLRRARTRILEPRRSVHSFGRSRLSPEKKYLPKKGRVFKPYQPPKLEAWVHNLEGERTAIVPLSNDVFGVEIRRDIVHRAAEWWRACHIQTTHIARTRNMVKGATRKLTPQKGSGNARRGGITSPIHRGGGKAHGPKIRDVSYKLPLKVRRAAVRSALTSKLEEGNLYVIDDLSMDTYKTSAFVSALDAFDVAETALFVHGEDELNPRIMLASRNLQWVDFMSRKEASVEGNVYDMIKYRTLFVTRQALRELQRDLRPINRRIKYVAPPLSELVASGEIQLAQMS